MILLGVIVLLNVVLSFFFFRVDLTEDQRFSLSPATKSYLQENGSFNKTRVHLKIYLAGDLPADLEMVRKRIKEKLNEFKVYAGDKITYEFINPDATDDEAFNQQIKEQLHAQGEGIWPTDIEIIESGEVSLKTIWPGAELIINGVVKDRLHFFTPGRTYTSNDLKGVADKTINELEFTLISHIKKAVNPNKKKIAFIKGHGELSNHSTDYVKAGLQGMYQVDEVVIDEKINALEEFDAAIIAKPTKRFSEKDKFIIDQFIMGGGAVAWFIDILDVNRDSLYFRGKTFGLTQPLNLEDQLFKYGVRINPDLVIDEKCAPIYVPGHPKGVLPWYFYPIVQPNANHPITKNIDPIKTEYVSSIDLVGKGNIKKDILLTTSEKSGKYGTPVRIDYRMVDTKPNLNQIPNHQGFPVAVMLEGEFESLYKNRLSPELEKAEDFSFKESSKPVKMLVVADGDVIRNEVDSVKRKDEWLYRPFPMEYDANELRALNMKGQNGGAGLEYMYGNFNFILNAIDYMIDEDRLLEVRSKSISLRLLDKEKIKSERSFWKALNLSIPLLMIVVLGVYMTINRKRKYSK